MEKSEKGKKIKNNKKKKRREERHICTLAEAHISNGNHGNNYRADADGRSEREKGKRERERAEEEKREQEGWEDRRRRIGSLRPVDCAHGHPD